MGIEQVEKRKIECQNVIERGGPTEIKIMLNRSTIIKVSNIKTRI